MTRKRKVLAGMLALAGLAGIVWQLFSLYAGGHMPRANGHANATPDSAFFAHH